MYYINGKCISLKDLREAEKHGETIETMADEYGVSPEEFDENLRRMTKRFYAEHRRAFEKNAKRNKNLETPDVTCVVPENCEERELEPSGISKEEELEAKLNKYKQELENLLKAKQTSEGKIAESFVKTEEIRKKLLELAEEIKGYNRALEILQEQRNVEKDRIDDLEEVIKQKEDDISKVTVELDACKEVVVFYGEEGLAISQNGFEPTQNEIEAKSSELSKTGKFDEYALKAIKAAAAILCAVESLTIMEMRYSIEYDKCIPSVKNIITEALAA